MKKKFKFSYSPLVIVILIVGIVIAVAAFVMQLISLINNPYPSAYNIVTFISVTLVTAFYLSLAVSMFVASYYMIDDKYLTLRWGILKNQLEIKSMTEVDLNDDTHTLTIFYNEDNFFVLKSATIPFADLVEGLMSVNKNINFKLSGVKTPDDQNKNA